MIREDLLESLNRMLFQKLERLEKLEILLENLDDTVHPALMRSSLDAIETLQKQLLNGDVLFLSVLDKFLKANSARSLGELPKESLAPLKAAQRHIKEIDVFQNRINPMLAQFEGFKESLKADAVKAHQKKQVDRTYGKK